MYQRDNWEQLILGRREKFEGPTLEFLIYYCFINCIITCILKQNLFHASIHIFIKKKQVPDASRNAIEQTVHICR